MPNLVKAPIEPSIHTQVLKLIKESERVYYGLKLEEPEDIWLVEQLVTLLSNLLDNHPELEQDYKEFIDHLRTL